MTNEYKAENIGFVNELAVARDKLDFGLLKDRIQKRGDTKKIADEYNINRVVLTRALNEDRILSIFSKISRSKAQPLSTIKFDRELKLFAKYYNVHKLSVRQLYKKVKEWRKKIQYNPRLLLSSLQHDLIIGSTIGDANIRQRNRNCNFRVGHTNKQTAYLLWKYNIIHEFALSKPTWNIRKLNDRNIITLELSTATHYAFNYYRKLFYKNRVKKITREILNMLNPRSLAIWLCDDGSYDKKQGYIVFCTNAYSLKEHKIMKNYFEEIWNLSPTIGFRDKKYYYLRFKQEDSKKLIEIVKPFILKSILYKIGEQNE